MIVEQNQRAARKMYQTLLRQHLKPGCRKPRLSSKVARLKVQKKFGIERATFFRYMAAGRGATAIEGGRR